MRDVLEVELIGLGQSLASITYRENSDSKLWGLSK